MTHTYESPFYFAWSGARYAVKGGDLRGVVAHPDPAVLPGATSVVMGLIAWRGAVIPMLAPNESVDPIRVRVAVVVETDSGDLALAADEVFGWDVPEGEIHPLDVDRIYHSARETVRLAHPDADGESR